MVFHSFNIQAVDPTYVKIDDIGNGKSHFTVEFKYFIAGLGRCSNGECGSETFKFFLHIIDTSTNQTISIREFSRTLNQLGGAFNGTLQIDELIGIKAPKIDFRLFIWDLNDKAMSDVLSTTIIRSLTELPPSPPEPITNFSEVVTFPDGHTIVRILSEADHNLFLSSPLPDGVVAISTTTTSGVTATLSIYLNLIEIHRVSDIVIPPEPEPENVLYKVSFNLPNSTFNPTFILTPAENQILLAHVFDVLVVLTFPLATTLQTTHTAQQMITEIEIALASELQEPPQAGGKSYTMELKSSSYLSTPEGKTIFIQIEVTKIGTGVDSAFAELSIKQGLTGVTILVDGQNLQIGGANIFSIVFNIPDIGATGEATATLDFIVRMLFSETDQRALTEFPVTGKLIFEAPPTTPPPTMAQGSVMQKILGGLAMLGTTILLSSKGR